MKLTEITLDTELQSRVEINEDTVNDYSEALREGAKFPAVTVYHDGSRYYLADGWHRYFAHKKAGLALIEANVVEGSKRDAVLCAIGANYDHGLRRTNADKRKAVMTLLDDFEWSEWNDKKISQVAKVSIMTVGRIRKELGAVPTEVKYERNGKEFTMKRPELKVAEKAEPKLEYEFDEKEEKIHELATEIQAIAEENEMLKAKVAVASMDASDEDKQAAQDLIAELQTKVKTQDSEIVHYKARVHSLMRENADLKAQIKRQDRQIFALQNKKAA